MFPTNKSSTSFTFDFSFAFTFLLGRSEVRLVSKILTLAQIRKSATVSVISTESYERFENVICCGFREFSVRTIVIVLGSSSTLETPARA